MFLGLRNYRLIVYLKFRSFAQFGAVKFEEF